MLRLSRWMAKSAFGIGLAVGCMLNVGLAPLLEARGEPVPTVVESVEVVADAGPVVPAFGELQQVNLDLQAKLLEGPILKPVRCVWRLNPTVPAFFRASRIRWMPLS